MIDTEKFEDFADRRDRASLSAMLDDARGTAVPSDDVRSDVHWGIRMSDVILKRSASVKLTSDPKIRQWQQDKSARDVPFLGYYRRSYSTSRDGTVTEHGDGFMLTTIDPRDADETRDIVIRSVAVAGDFAILVGGDEDTMSASFSIGWSKGKYTYEPQVPS